MTKRIQRIAIKKSTGEILTAPIGKKHADIGARGEHGFISSGKFVNRETAARIANAAGQVKRAGIKHLHSHQLKRR